MSLQSQPTAALASQPGGTANINETPPATSDADINNTPTDHSDTITPPAEPITTKDPQP